MIDFTRKPEDLVKFCISLIDLMVTIYLQIETPSTRANSAFVLGVLHLAENLIRVEKLPLKTENS